MTELLPVTQADRDRVQAFHSAMLDKLMTAVKDKAAQSRFGEDEGDAGTLVQMFAAHRIAATPSPDSGERMREAYLVWSNEHQAWWGKDRCGYTRFIDRAGRYDRTEALSIAGTRDGGWHVRKGNPDEIAIPERDAIEQYAGITQSQREAALQKSAR